MGYHLVGEVLDTCPKLSYREFRVLIALALDARDDTRRAMPGMDTITLRAGCGRRNALHALARLRDRGLIKSVEAAAPGRRAVYEILPAAATRGPRSAPVSGGPRGAPERVQDPGQRVHVSGRTGGPRSAPPQSPPQSYTSGPPAVAGEPRPDAPTILAAFIKADTASGGKLTSSTRSALGARISQMLSEGISARVICQALADWRSAPGGAHPNALPSFADAVMRGPGVARARGRQAETDAMFARMEHRARMRDAGIPGYEPPWETP